MKKMLVTRDNYDFCSLWGAFNLVTFNAIIFLLCMSHIRAVFTDPGTIPLIEDRMDFSDMHPNTDSGSIYSK